MRTSASREDTLARASALIAEAAARGARLIVLPEAFTGLYGVHHFASNAEEWKGKDSGTQLMARAAQEHGVYVCGGVIEEHPIKKTLFNTIAAFGFVHQL